MSSVYVYLFGTLIGLVLQTSVLRNIIPFGMVPNFALIMLVHIAFFWQRQSAVWLVFLLGLLVDLFGSAELLGPHASAAVAVYLGITIISKRLYMESDVTILVVVFCASLLNTLVVAIVHNQFKDDSSVASIMLNHAPFEAVGSAIFAWLVFALLKKMGMGKAREALSGGLSWS